MGAADVLATAYTTNSEDEVRQTKKVKRMHTAETPPMRKSTAERMRRRTTRKERHELMKSWGDLTFFTSAIF